MLDLPWYFRHLSAPRSVPDPAGWDVSPPSASHPATPERPAETGPVVVAVNEMCVNLCSPLTRRRRSTPAFVAC